MIKISELYQDNILNKYLNKYEYPYEVLENISIIIKEIINDLDNNYYKLKDNVYIHKNSNVSKAAIIESPCIIMENTTIRHNAYIRGNVIIGPNCLVGNSEIKNSILLGSDNIPHFNYVGDSLLGTNINMGAGSKIANLRFDRDYIKVEDKLTNLRKIGAFIGDNVNIGCNAVIAPGMVIPKNTIIYPLTYYQEKKSDMVKL